MPPLLEPPTGAISFQVLAEIAAGETARIDLCRALGDRDGQLLAVKRLHAHVAEDPAFANMFLDEVWMTAALKHKNVVEVAGWGTDAEGAYLAVELVQGVSLARLMKTVFETGEVFSERMVVFIAAELCAGLAAAHALAAPNGEPLQLVHRDLTPGNVLVGFQGDVKIADFGLAKARRRITQTLTGALKGKPQYMAPEQARGLALDGRADLFSLGVVMFELFAGRRPWSATSELAIMHVTATAPPLDLRELRPKIDKELVAIVERCLQREPAARFQTAGEIRARLEEWLGAHGYLEGNDEALGRFVRRNAMRQMRWFERAIAGQVALPADPLRGVHTEAPRAPSYTGASEMPLFVGAVPTPGLRARVKSRKRTETDTDVEPQWGQESAGRPPPVLPPRPAPTAARKRTPDDDAIDWGEEVPTLVQKPGTVLGNEIARARLKARAAAGHPPLPSAALPRVRAADEEDEEADEDADLATTAVKPAAPQDLVERALAQQRHVRIEEAPSPEPPRAVFAAAASEPAIEPPSASRSSGTPFELSPLPGQVVAPHPSAPPPPTGPRFNAPPLPSAVTPPPLPVVANVGPQTIDRAAGVASPQVLAAEAQRLAAEAQRRGDDAKAAAASAERKAALARLAAEAARVAADALAMVASGGLVQASARLDEALALSATLAREVASEAAPPESLSRPSPVFGAPPAGAPAVQELARRPSPSPPLLRPPDAAPMSVAGVDDAAFRRQLQPTVLGVPVGIAVALGAGGLALLALLVWLTSR